VAAPSGPASRLLRMADLEERTLEPLPDRCQNCGTPLTDAEKQTALEEPNATALCTTCAVEATALPEEEVEDLEA
jgi:uncharacterized protein with PIN domain